jgi:hypothetical protein
MGVMMELLPPGVQHGEAPTLRAKMLGIPGHVLERLGDGAQEQALEQARGLECQWPEVMRERKNHMDGWRVKDRILPGGQPGGLGGAMTCGTAAVATRGVRLHLGSTVVALGDMATEGRGPA